jgi:hypothetical protein
MINAVWLAPSFEMRVLLLLVVILALAASRRLVGLYVFVKQARRLTMTTKNIERDRDIGTGTELFQKKLRNSRFSLRKAKRLAALCGWMSLLSITVGTYPTYLLLEMVGPSLPVALIRLAESVLAIASIEIAICMGLHFVSSWSEDELSKLEEISEERRDG